MLKYRKRERERERVRESARESERERERTIKRDPGAAVLRCILHQSPPLSALSLTKCHCHSEAVPGPQRRRGDQAGALLP